MGLDLHTVEIPNGTTPTAKSDRILIGRLAGVAVIAGSGAGATVTTAVSGLELPPSYSVVICDTEDSVGYISNKTSTGFNVVRNPRLAANTLAAGTIDLMIFA